MKWGNLNTFSGTYLNHTHKFKLVMAVRDQGCHIRKYEFRNQAESRMKHRQRACKSWRKSCFRMQDCEKKNTLFQFPSSNLRTHQQAKTADFNCLDWYTGRMTISKVKNLSPNQTKKVGIPWHIHEPTGEKAF